MMKVIQKNLKTRKSLSSHHHHRRRRLPKPDLDHLKPPKVNNNLNHYVNSNRPTKALSLFRDLFRTTLSSIDSFSLLFVLKACTLNSSIVEGKASHCTIFKLGFDNVVQIQTSLLKMYSSTANLLDARKVFDEMSDRNVVSWTALISAYVENRKPSEALHLFRRMQSENVDPDRVTITVAITACADLGALTTGEWLSAYARRKSGLAADLPLNNALVNMYGKCGDTSSARRLFDAMPRKDVTTWTAMIVGYALNGQASEALVLFAAMKVADNLITPNDATFVGVLMACSHAGLVEEGKRHFRSMTEDFGLTPRAAHFGCIVDLLCRTGRLDEARELVDRIPPKEAGAVVWRTLLGVCSRVGGVNAGIAAEAEQRLGELELGHAGDGVAASNAYAAGGMWERKARVREEQRMGVRRLPGCSAIEVEALGVSEFVASDSDHPSRVEICGALKCLHAAMKERASFSHTCWLHDSQCIRV